MAQSFGIPQLVEYLNQMGLKISRIDEQQELLELVFHGEQGQWRLVVGLQRRDGLRKLMLIVPHVTHITQRKRLECLEALMAVNYRIAIGKFGLDLEDGEIRLEETIPLADHDLSFDQFQLAVGAIMQTVSIYNNLLPRIIYKGMPVQEALQTCEQEFFQQDQPKEDNNNKDGEPEPEAPGEISIDELPELNVEDILAEVARIFEKSKE
ncbi:YbjN domain-containing protein [Ktedonospora formicarum]|uniref:YbjN domain-containing protein n=1 Tax=Ktedonospora formicarum TaxID=2778364 RepID=A0A8J3MUE3_9CHLR|nr:YbjN domain-containing protein [Ktedonospora formicarum]GHO45320.1 hypothetical protein KSX_34830 [Ktedonospora formicarum]